MKKFLKEEWFKILLLLLVFYAVTLLYISKDKTNQEVVQQAISTRVVTSDPLNIMSTTTETVLNQQKPVIKNTVASIKTPQRIIDQVKSLDDFLEYDVIGTDIDCSSYAVYNNVVGIPSQLESPDDFKTMFPDSKETYESKCLSSYVEMNKNNKFVAEPELVDLRKAISEYANTVHDFALYALNGGYSTSVINVFDKKAKIERLDAREKVLAMKRKYFIQ